jgi:ascorbate-specific PTS system EIIC-type component UlaA
MKKYLLSPIIISLLTFPLLVLAQDPAEIPRFSGLGFYSRLEVLRDWIFTIFLITAVIFLVIAAFTFVTASGDPEKVIKARKFVLYALIGVAVAVAARGLVALVQMIMEG